MDSQVSQIPVASIQDARKARPDADSLMTNISQASDSAQQQPGEIQTVDEYARQYLAQQTLEVVVPSYAAWFQFDAIHDLEKKALPEFFSGRNRSKTPAVYKDYRDFMIHTYRLNPSEYLTVTACRRNLAGDVCALIRVHAFLEQWGLINYQVNPETRPSAIGPPFTGHFRVTADTPRGLTPFLPHATVTIPKYDGSTSGAATTGTATTESMGTSSQTTRPNIFQKPSGKTEPPKYACATCGSDCSVIRYHNTKTKDFDACASCYLEGRFPSSMHSGEFVKINTGYIQKSINDNWTDEENLLLLEGIEMFDDDWVKIAMHVGTRTKEQCVLHFLQLPIEDSYLEENVENLGPLQYNHIPFGQTDNPIMSVVAFLASVVNPGVASAAAKAALHQIGLEMGTETSKESNAAPKQPGETPADTKKPHFDVQKAASSALGAAAVKAKLLADYEEKEIQRLMNALIEMQLRKFELKMNHLEELETILENEKREIERQRQQLFVERMTFQNSLATGKAEVDPSVKLVNGEERAAFGETSMEVDGQLSALP